MKIVFFGTPDYVVPILEEVNKKLRTKSENAVVAVVTQGPKPVGRDKTFTFSPVDTWAHSKNARINNPDSKIKIMHEPADLISQKVVADIGILASYGEIIPDTILKMFPLGILNIHPSILPKFRGASPVAATVLTQEQAGCTIIKLDSQMDHGPILAQFKEDLLDTDTNQTLRDRLFERATDVLIELIPAYVKGKITPKPQDHDQATYTRLIKKADGFVPFANILKATEGETAAGSWEVSFVKNLVLTFSPENIAQFSKSLFPWPLMWSSFKTKDGQEKRLIIYPCAIKSGKLKINHVMVEGKNPVTWEQFKEGYLKN